MEEKIMDVQLDLIDPPGDAHRETIDPEAVRELAESIRERGLQQRIKLRPLNGRYEIVYGHRRFLAHRLLGMDKIKAEVVELNDEQVLMTRCIENIQRENLKPIETARVYGRMREKLELTVDQIARSVGKSVLTVRKYLGLLELEEEFQRAVNDQKISIASALVLNEIDDPSMRRYYLQSGVMNGVTEKVAQMWVEDYKRSRGGSYYEGAGGEPGGVAIQGAPVIYQTCAGCRGPIDSSQVRYVPLCPECIEVLEGRGK